MTTPNQMPKKPNSLAVQIVDGLIGSAAAVWERKTLSKDGEGKEVIEKQRVARSVLRYPLAQNVSEMNVERIAKRLL